MNSSHCGAMCASPKKSNIFLKNWKIESALNIHTYKGSTDSIHSNFNTGSSGLQYFTWMKGIFKWKQNLNLFGSSNCNNLQERKNAEALKLFEQHVPPLDTSVSKSIEQLLAIL
jgi:hypothetical protein